MNLMPAQVVEANGSGVAVALPSGGRVTVPASAGAARVGDAVTLGVRPEGLHIDPSGP